MKSILKLLLISSIFIVLSAFAFKEPEWTVIQKPDGSWYRCQGDAVVEYYDKSNRLDRKLYTDISGRFHTVVYGEDGLEESHIVRE